MSAPAPHVRARPWRTPEPPRRILAIRLHALGDTVITLPYLDALRRALPGSAIDLLTREEVGGIPRSTVLFDRVHEIGGGRDPRRILLHALRLVPRLRSRRYDLVLDLQRSRVSRAVRHLLRPAAWSEFDRVSPRAAGERTRDTIEAAGTGPLQLRRGLTLRRPDAGEQTLRAAGWDGEPLVVLNPVGAFPGRAWPVASFARFARLWDAAVPGCRFLVLGTPDLLAAAAELADRLGPLRPRLLDLAGRTTAAEAFAILARSRLVVSEDSGLMHMAWVAGAPTLALFGASRSAWSRPLGPAAGHIQACERDDGACIDGRCRAAADGAAACLRRLEPERVLRHALALPAPGDVVA